MKKARNLIESKDYKEATENLWTIIRILDDKCQEAAYLYGVCQLHLGDVDRAVLYLMKSFQNGYNVDVEIL